jgi:hypothetical protein
MTEAIPPPSLTDLHHLLGTTELRMLSCPAEKGWLLKTKYHASTSDIVKLGICSKASLFRALSAKAEKREVGKCGRPPNLNEEDSNALKQMIEIKARERKHLTAKDVNHLVFLFYFHEKFLFAFLLCLYTV